MDKFRGIVGVYLQLSDSDTLYSLVHAEKSIASAEQVKIILVYKIQRQGT